MKNIYKTYIYTENYKKVIRENKGLNKQIFSIHDMNDNIIMSLFPRLVYRFNAMPNEIPTGLFLETGKVILKCICKYKGPRIVKQL